MPKVPIKPLAETRTSPASTPFQNVRVGVSDAPGRALQRLGQTFAAEATRHAKATDRIRRRQDAVGRVAVLEATEEHLKAEFAKEADEGSNFGNVEAVQAFQAHIQGVAAKALEGHQGSEESSIVLGGALSSLVNKFSDAAVGTGATEMKAKQARQLTKFQAELANEVANGLPLDQAFLKNAERVAQYVDSQAPDETQEALDAGKEQLALAAINQSINVDDLPEARKVLNANAKFLSKGVAQTVRNRLIVMETTTARKTAEFDTEVASIVRGIGRKLTSDELLKLKGAYVKPALTIAEKIAQTELAVGPLTEDQRDKVAGVHIAEKGDAALTPSRARTTLNDVELLQGFAQNTLSPEDELMAQAALTAALTPTVDPITRTSQPGLLPPAWINALAMRGRTPEEFVAFRSGQEALPALADVVQTAPQLAPQAGTTAQPEQFQMMESLLSTAPAEAQEASTTLKEILGEVAPFVFGGDKTFWDLGGDFTGLIPAVQRGAGRVPGVGTLTGGGKTAAELKTFIPGAFRQLVEILRINSRSQKEAEEIRIELSIDPSILDTEAAYKRRMIGVSKSLALREKLAGLALEGPLGPQERRRLLFLHGLISQFRTVVTPPLIAGESREDTIKQVEKFFSENPPGTRFLFRTDDDEWVEDVVPQAQSGETP